jgi:hypothetical protein
LALLSDIPGADAEDEELEPVIFEIAAQGGGTSSTTCNVDIKMLKDI